MNQFDQFKYEFFKITENITGQVTDHNCTFDLTINFDKKFGDVTSNIALLMSKKTGKNPRDLANQIIEKLNYPFIKKIEIAGPGFINIFLTEEFFENSAKELFLNKDHYFFMPNINENFNVEFVSANPTGPLHIGHGRNGILGDVISRVLSFIGLSVTKEHYINDAGVQMERLGQSLKLRCLEQLGKTIEIPEDGYHGQYLIELAKEYCAKSSTIETDSKEDFINFGYKELLSQQQNTLKKYCIEFDVWFSEKTLHDKSIEHAIERLNENNALYQKDGATWFKSTDYGDDKDRVLKKADGSYTYAAADAAYLLNKASRGFTRLIYILGQDHHSYPNRMNGIKTALGLSNVTIDFILYQLVSIKSNGESLRLSKRAGRIIDLADIIETVGCDVARFFYLNRKADAHLEFDIDLALKKTDENPVYYLQYAYVRNKTVIERSQEIEEFLIINENDCTELEDAEQLLIKKLISLKNLLSDISKNYQIHLLTYYLIELANLYHNYYHHNKIIDLSDIKTSRARLFISILINDMFERCFNLIGISKPNKM